MHLLNNAFDIRGNALAHLACLRAKLGVSEYFMSSCHQAAMEKAKAPTQQVTKAEFISLALHEEDVIRNAEDVTSFKAFFKALKDDDVLLVKSLVGSHGLKGKVSNNKRLQEREHFREWVKLHRSPTGRTQASSGLSVTYVYPTCNLHVT